MSKELLEAISNDLKKCPICEALNPFKISGFIGKNLECTNCEAQWSGGTYDDGDKWLRLTKPSKTGLGEAKIGVIWRPLPLDFWLHKNKPFQTIEHYANIIYEYFKEFEDFRQEFGNGEFKGGQGLMFIGPTIDIVASIKIFWEKKKANYDIYIAVIDQTSTISDKNRDDNDLFLYMISKKLFIFTEETGLPITPYLIPKGENEGKEVKENWFYPFKDLDERTVVVREGFKKNLLLAFVQMKPKKQSNKLANYFSNMNDTVEGGYE